MGAGSIDGFAARRFQGQWLHRFRRVCRNRPVIIRANGWKWRWEDYVRRVSASQEVSADALGILDTSARAALHERLLPRANPARGGVAQLVRASACHAEGRGFEPRRSRQFLAFSHQAPQANPRSRVAEKSLVLPTNHGLNPRLRAHRSRFAKTTHLDPAT
jgi:hypothetical protein